MTTAFKWPGRGKHLRVPLKNRLRVVGGILATLLLPPLLVALPATAADGDAKPILTTKSVSKANAEAGDLIQYTINYSCSNGTSNSPIDGCDGAVFKDPLPKFTDIYGAQVPVTFVSASGPIGVWPGQFSLDTTDTANPFVKGTAGTWAAGTSGAINVTVRIPSGVVPAAQQTITNKATVKDAVVNFSDDSTVASTKIQGTAPTWKLSKEAPANHVAYADQDVDWKIKSCTADPKSSLWPIFEITDTLPPGAKFVSATNGGTFTDDGATLDISDGAATVKWKFDATNHAPLGSDGCFTMFVKTSFPDGYVAPVSSDHPNDDNVNNAYKENSVTGVGKNTPGGSTTALNTATDYVKVSVGPRVGNVWMNKTMVDANNKENYWTSPGEENGFGLGGELDDDLPADKVEIVEGSYTYDNPTNGVGVDESGGGLPPDFKATAVVPGNWTPSTVPLKIEASNDNFANVVVLGDNLSPSATAIPVSTNYRYFRWTYGGTTGSIPKNFDVDWTLIVGESGSLRTNAGTYTNTAKMIEYRDSNTYEDSNDAEYNLDSPRPHPEIKKTVSKSVVSPGETNTYTIHVENNYDAPGDLADPYVEDCLPDHRTLQPLVLPSGWTTETATHSCDTGQTAIRFRYTGTLTPGQSAPDVVYSVKVNEYGDVGGIAPPAEYATTAYVRADTPEVLKHCVNTSPVCGSNTSVQVQPTIALDSQKCVSGDLDYPNYRPSPACTDDGSTTLSAKTLPGGIMKWELKLRNSGNVDTNNVEFIDVFPHAGDTSVLPDPISGLVPRNTEWDPILTTAINVPVGWTVSYSESENPCRDEVGGPSDDCEAPNWVTNPATQTLSRYKSIRMQYNSDLAMGATATFAWSMRAPVTDDTYAKGSTTDPYAFVRNCSATAPASDATHCPRALNAFAYGADAANVPNGLAPPSRLFAEPPPVEVRVVAPPIPNMLGDRVFFDRNFDGMQAADHSANGEFGISGILLRLFNVSDMATPLDQTFTDANGNYLFSGGKSGLSGGTYVIRAYVPDGFKTSPTDKSGTVGDAGATANTNDDSDFPFTKSGTDSTGDYYDSPSILLGNDKNTNVGQPNEGETDLTWDLGLWTAQPALSINKTTKETSWDQSKAGDGVEVTPKRSITWTYDVTNTGNTRLDATSFKDDNGGGGATAFNVTTCTITKDGDNVGGLHSTASPLVLNRGATARCTATGTAGSAAYANSATLKTTPKLDDGTAIPSATPPNFTPAPASVNASDTSSYNVPNYDLALIQTVNNVTTENDFATFQVTVANQGGLPSNNFVVKDQIPAGLKVLEVSDGGSWDPVTRTVTWNGTNIDPEGTHVFTVKTSIEDFTLRPFTAHAWIYSDGSSDYGLTDVDSTPSTTGPFANAVDNTLLSEAGVGTDAGHDDDDPATFNVTIRYDLDLIKTVTSRGPYKLGDFVEYAITVSNQGNVPSHGYEVTDTLPAGLEYISSSITPNTVNGSKIVWSDLPSIAPGGASEIKLTARIVKAQPGYKNLAQITADGTGSYSTPSDPIHDVDSSPDNAVVGDVVPRTDPSKPPTKGEDDADVAMIAIGLVTDPGTHGPGTPAKATPKPGAKPKPGPQVDSRLARTGTDIKLMAFIGSGLLISGTITNQIRIRRRKTREIG